MKAKSRPVTTPAAEHPPRAKLLVVEDETDLQEVLRHNLTREGFSIRLASTGEQALQALRQDPPDLILLDVMLPGTDGLDVCRLCRSDPATASIPIIMLTAKGEEADVVTGLELGADDYITKPFSARVLIARIKVALRRQSRNETEDEDSLVQVGQVAIDPLRHEVRVAGAAAPLTRTEFRILHLLARRSGRVFTRAQIVQAAQGDNVAVTDRSVDVHIVALRRKLGDAGRYIQTIRGVGYRIEGD